MQAKAKGFQPRMSMKQLIEDALDKREWLSIRGLAREIGISDATVRRILKGEERLDHETLLKLSKYFRVPIVRLYQAAGYLPETLPNPGIAPDLEMICTRISEKNPAAREALVNIINSLLDNTEALLEAWPTPCNNGD